MATSRNHDVMDIQHRRPFLPSRLRQRRAYTTPSHYIHAHPPHNNHSWHPSRTHATISTTPLPRTISLCIHPSPQSYQNPHPFAPTTQPNVPTTPAFPRAPPYDTRDRATTTHTSGPRLRSLNTG